LLDARRIAAGARATLHRDQPAPGRTASRSPWRPSPAKAALGEGLTAVVRADLERSGLFRLLEVAADVACAHRGERGELSRMALAPADALVLGSVSARATGVSRRAFACTTW